MSKDEDNNGTHNSFSNDGRSTHTNQTPGVVSADSENSPEIPADDGNNSTDKVTINRPESDINESEETLLRRQHSEVDIAENASVKSNSRESGGENEEESPKDVLCPAVTEDDGVKKFSLGDRDSESTQNGATDIGENRDPVKANSDIQSSSSDADKTSNAVLEKDHTESHRKEGENSTENNSNELNANDSEALISKHESGEVNERSISENPLDIDVGDKQIVKYADEDGKVNDKELDGETNGSVNKDTGEKINDQPLADESEVTQDSENKEEENVEKGDEYDDDFEETGLVSDAEVTQDSEYKGNESIEKGDEYDDDFEETGPISDAENDNIDNFEENSTSKEHFTESEKDTEKENTTDSVEKIEKDIQQAKGEWEKSVSEIKNSEHEKSENNEEVLNEPEGEVTKVVVDDDGIPKVLVTTVPDRPPSSQCSEHEINEAYGKTDGVEDKEECEKDNGAEKTSVSDNENNDKSDQSIIPADKTDAHAEGKTEIYTEDPYCVADQNHQHITDFESSEDFFNDTNNSVEDSKPVEKTNYHQQFKTETNTKQTDNMDTMKEGYSNDSAKDEKFAAENSKNNDEAIVRDVKPDEKENMGENKKDVSVEEKQENSNQTAEKEDKVAPAELELKKKTESPLEQLLKRNVEIDGTVETITQLEQNVITLLVSMKEVMGHYLERLKLQTLRDITEDMGKFRGDFSSVNEAFSRYSAMGRNLNQRLKELRHVTEDVKSQISRKFVSEDLSTWVDVPPEQEQGTRSIYTYTTIHYNI